jgi:hypothetical protein
MLRDAHINLSTTILPLTQHHNHQITLANATLHYIG